MVHLSSPASSRHSSPLGDQYDKILLITINHAYAGFFAYVTFVINQLIYAEERGLLPVVYFGPVSWDGPNAFYDAARGDNTWDYYFEPVAGWTYAEIKSLVESPSRLLSHKDIVQLSREELWYLHECAPQSVYNYPYGAARHDTADPQEWYRVQRLKANRYIQKYIRVKSEILDELESYVSDRFGREPVLGAHMRGTDKGSAGSSASLMRVIGPESYFPHIDRYLEQHAGARVFLATDQSQFVERVRARYGDRLLTFDAIRSSSAVNTFQVFDSRNYRKGREVLLDCLVLSRCNYLLKCTSAVGEYAMYFNPALECIDLNLAGMKPRMGDEVRVSWNRARSLSWSRERGTDAASWRDRFRRSAVRTPLLYMLSEAVERRRLSTTPAWQLMALLKDSLGALAHSSFPWDLVRYRARTAHRRRGAQLFDRANVGRQKYLEIRLDYRVPVDLSDQILRLLVQLEFARAYRLVPVVCLDWPLNPYLEREHGPNVWDYYFETAAGVSPRDLDAVPPSEVVLLGPEQTPRLVLGAGNYTVAAPERLDEAGQEWFRRRRSMGADLVRTFLRPLPELSKDVNDFYRAHMDGRTVLGVQLDPATWAGPPHAPLTLDDHWTHLERFLTGHPDGCVLVAASDLDTVSQALKRIGDRAISVDRPRVVHAGPAKETAGGVRGGWGHLVETLLLSRCDSLLHGGAPQADVATFFGPDLKSVDLRYPVDTQISNEVDR